jgi:hypothetical protein
MSFKVGSQSADFPAELYTVIGIMQTECPVHIRSERSKTGELTAERGSHSRDSLSLASGFAIN